MDKELFHKLEGKTVFFKPVSLEDLDTIHFYASDEDVSRFIGWPLMKSVEETKELVELMIQREIDGTHLYASAVSKETGDVVGTVMIFNFDHEANHAEVGYVFDKRIWGQGYGSESIGLLTDFAFKSLNLHKLHARVVDENVGSAKVLEKNNYSLEGRLKDQYFIEGRYYDSLLYGKLNPNK